MYVLDLPYITRSQGKNAERTPNSINGSLMPHNVSLGQAVHYNYTMKCISIVTAHA